ncbi:hypothetical protein LXL04_003582 [Taraxacum kok-saghyz]
MEEVDSSDEDVEEEEDEGCFGMDMFLEDVEIPSEEEEVFVGAGSSPVGVGANDYCMDASNLVPETVEVPTISEKSDSLNVDNDGACHANIPYNTCSKEASDEFCFGPFPSTIPVFHPGSLTKGTMANIGKNSFSKISRSNRRKASCPDIRFSPYKRSPLPLRDSPPRSVDVVIPHMPVSLVTVDLNCGNNSSPLAVNSPVIDDGQSPSTEIDRTIEVGSNVGFQFEREEPVFSKTRGEMEEIIG